jgi:hypothetical protein
VPSLVAAVVVGARVPFDVPIEISREDAQRLARLELAKPEYTRQEESLVSRILNWIGERVSDALDAASGVSPLAWLGLVGIVLLVVLAIIAIRRRTGALTRSTTDPLFEGRERSAVDHRRESERLAEAGAYAEAVRERLRAIVRDLQERGIVEDLPGRTADEIARDAGAALPAAAGDLRSAARLFDDIWYGGRTADRASYDRMVEVERLVRDARPGQGGSSADRPLAVPR